MNYRHAFHAGNFADVMKHCALIALIESMKRKQTPFCYLDTHAGAGRYRLTGPEATRTGEFLGGVARVIGTVKLPSVAHVYANLVHAMNARTHAGALVEYPGSPLLASLLMREHDRLILCELQEAELADLRANFRGDRRVEIHQRDGYGAMNALLPPKERRALVLVDPPYEAQEQEFDAIRRALTAALKKMPAAVVAIWYPIKLRQTVQPFHRWLRQSGLPKVLACELLLHPDNSALRLNGSGLVFINAPWQLDRTLGELMPALLGLLGQGRFGDQRVEWIRREG